FPRVPAQRRLPSLERAGGACGGLRARLPVRIFLRGAPAFPGPPPSPAQKGLRRLAASFSSCSPPRLATRFAGAGLCLVSRGRRRRGRLTPAGGGNAAAFAALAAGRAAGSGWNQSRSVLAA
ncbi:hypothetical protein H1C71_036610, partial [Ictidomys tridecemlineatus]